ncbi:MAG: hypothetical protein ACREE4_00820 [Stellaceae bacterium]
MTEPCYWLGVDTPQVWAEWKQKYDPNKPLLFGFPASRKMSVKKMKIGDRIINYMKTQHRLFAVWDITGGYVYDPNYIWGLSR